MYRCLAVLLAVLSGVLGGCFTSQPERSTSLFGPGGSLPGPAGGDVVQIDVAVVERRLGDPYLNGELWEQADEQAVDLERKVVLEDNGFRAGLIGKVPPAGLRDLLDSPRSNPDPHCTRLRAGNPLPVALGRPWKRCRFHLVQDEAAAAVELDDAECLLEIVPTLSDDGRTLLRFTPHVKHGQPSLAPRAVREPSGTYRWERETQQPDEAYLALTWEVALVPNEYLVVGTRLDRADTLGHRCFLATGASPPLQRLLVIRTARPQPRAGPGAEAVGGAPPVAMQATWTSARGQAD
jgi:hypothetical protein